MKHGRDETRQTTFSGGYCVCGLRGAYDGGVDSFYCPTSGVWLEPDCGCDPSECPFTVRPATSALVQNASIE